MCADLSRRDLLKAAGGLTFLALMPTGRGRFALEWPTGTAPRLPQFTALPYVQPGDNSRLVPGAERSILAWQTDVSPADFTVEYGTTSRYGHAAKLAVARRGSDEADDGESKLNYTAAFVGLELGTTYQYRVTLAGRRFAEGYFTTRKPRGAPTRFVAFGDNSYGDISDRAIAYQAYRARPDFVMNTGDNVYEGGLDNEYARYFFPVVQRRRGGPRASARRCFGPFRSTR